MRIALTLLACTLAAPTLAQTWSARIDGPGDDRLLSARALADGSMLVTGTSDSWSTARGAWMARLAPDGAVLWERTFGRIAAPWVQPFRHDDLGATCLVEAGGGTVARIEADGRLSWVVTPSEPTPLAAPLADGGCVIGGHIGDDVQVARLDATGSVAWSRLIDGTHPRDPGATGRLLVAGAAELPDGRIAVGVAHDGSTFNVTVEIFSADGTSQQAVPSFTSALSSNRWSSLRLQPEGTLVLEAGAQRVDAEGRLMDGSSLAWALQPVTGWGLSGGCYADCTWGPPTWQQCRFFGVMNLHAHGRRVISRRKTPGWVDLLADAYSLTEHDDLGAPAWSRTDFGLTAVRADGTLIRVTSPDAMALLGAAGDDELACVPPPGPPDYPPATLDAHPWPADDQADWIRPSASVTTSPASLEVTDTAASWTRLTCPPPPEPSALDLRPDSTPLLVMKAPGNALRLTWEDVGTPEYSVVDGALGSWPDGAHAACRLADPEATLVAGVGNRWFVATSWEHGVESSLGRASRGAPRAGSIDGCP